MNRRSLAIVKLGGSVITHKSECPPRTNYVALQRIAKELKTIEAPLLLILGGGAHGHQAANAYGYGNPRSTPDARLKGVPHIRHNMTLLSHDVQNTLQELGLPAVVIPPFCTTILKNGDVNEYFTKSISYSLDAGFIVITHGDVCFDLHEGAMILSGDTLVNWLADKLDATLILVGTDVDGIFDANPTIDPNASLLEKITPTTADQLVAEAGPSSAVDVTGGMSKKLSELLALARKGREVVIFNLTVPGRLERLLRHQDVPCTRISC